MRTFITNTQGRPELDYHAFCECADENSGNFYDFIPLGDSRLAVSFGDLPPASDVPSIHIPFLQALIRGLAGGGRGDLAGLARELNGTLYLLGSQDLCAPWFGALVDPVRHELQYVNAGHEPPLLIRGNGRMPQRLERTGAPLGLSVRGLHRQETTPVEPGDILAISSEGIGEALSEETLRDVILGCFNAGAAELTRRVLEEVHRSTRRPWVGEDCTFAAVRVVGAGRQPLREEWAQDPVALCAE